MTTVLIGFAVYLVVAASVSELLRQETGPWLGACVGLAWPVLVLMVCVYAFFAGVEQLFEDRP